MSSRESIRREFMYWTAQVIGWGFYAILLLFSIVVFGSENVSIGEKVGLQLIIVFSCLGVSHFLRSIYKSRQWARLNLGKALPRVLLVCLLGAIVAQLIIHIFIFAFFDWARLNGIIWLRLLTYVVNVFFVFVGWSVFYFGFHYYERGQRMELEKIKSDAALKEAELLALKAQVNPHFLFNALNNIRALILEDPAKARDMVSHLSELLRYSIQFQEKERVLLKTEMEIVEDYLNLESIQYENRLQFELDIDPQTTDKEIPPMVIQLLVENAVKHGISQLTEGGTVNVRTRLMGNEIHIEVKNTGHLASNETTGIGIQNALERIRILFEGDPYFSLQEIDGSVFANLKLPAV